MSRKKKKFRKTTRLVTKILSFIALIILILFLIFLYKMNVLPMKYFSLIAGILCFLEAIYLFFAFTKRVKIGFLIFLDIVAFIVLIIEGFATYKLYQTYDFMENDMQVTETKDYYYIVVNANSSYESIKNIEGKVVNYFNDGDDYKRLESNIKSKVNVVLDEVEDYSDLMDNVLKNKDKVILISESTYEAYLDNSDDETLKDNFKIIEKFEITTELEISDSKKDITSEPFILYLSGIDTRSGKMPKKSLSDVNMFIVVNPQTRKILMVNVPRDYYVQIHGTTGLKDKLTHAGMRGGVKLSKATMEDLLGYKADYYVRVNFNAVLNIVNAIGGVTIDSKDNFTYKLYHDKSCIIKPGKNKLNASCALAFARERYAYSSGDRHRGENQQQLIKAIVDKLSSSKSLVSNYDKILKALNGSFESNLSTKNITSMVQFQINDMRGWSFDTQNLNGSTGLEPCYSFPKGRLSVMYQNQKTIDAAKNKIKKVLNEN